MRVTSPSVSSTSIHTRRTMKWRFIPGLAAWMCRSQPSKCGRSACLPSQFKCLLRACGKDKHTLVQSNFLIARSLSCSKSVVIITKSKQNNGIDRKSTQENFWCPAPALRKACRPTVAAHHNIQTILGATTNSR